jgi:hypothetical protein
MDPAQLAGANGTKRRDLTKAVPGYVEHSRNMTLPGKIVIVAVSPEG